MKITEIKTAEISNDVFINGLFSLFFRVFNSDGVLTAEQMRTHLFAEMKNNCIDIELNEMLKALDQDNDGKIKVDDFIRLLTQENSIIKEDGGNSRCGDSCVILWNKNSRYTMRISARDPKWVYKDNRLSLNPRSNKQTWIITKRIFELCDKSSYNSIALSFILAITLMTMY